MLIIILGRIAQIILVIITMRVATTFLPPAEMARVFLISSAVAFYASILLNPVGMFMNRRLYSWNATGRIGYYYNYFWMYLLFVGLVASVSMAILVSTNLLVFHTDLGWLLFLIFSSTLISTANQMVIPGLNLLGYRTWFIYLTLATTAGSLVVASILVIIIKPSAEYWLMGLLIGQLLIAFVGRSIFYKHIKPPIPKDEVAMGISKNHLKLLWNFAWPILISAVLIWAQTQSYRFFMESSLGLVQVGLFVAGYGISAGIIAAFESIFTTYLQPIFYKHVSREDVIEQGKAWTNYASAILPSLLLVWFLTVASAPELTRLLLDGEYRDSSHFVVWGAIAELARVANGIYGMVAHAKMNTKILLWPNVIGAVVSVAMMFLLIPKYGAIGVGFALGLAGITVLIANYFVTRTELVTTLPYRALIKGFAAGVLLMVAANLARQILGTEGITSTFLLLVSLVSVYLLAQYWILRPLFHTKDKNIK